MKSDAAYPRVHVCLVGDRPVPNLTPCFDPAFAPESVVLVSTPGDEDRAQWMIDILRPRGIKTERWQIPDPFDITAIRDRLFDLIAERESEGLALNVTGGTRPMSLAAYETFRQLDVPVFYVNPITDHLVWLYHPEKPPPRDLADRIKLEPFLQVHGAEIESMGPRAGVPASLRALCDDLIGAGDRLIKPLASLNYLASSAEGSLYSDAMGYGLQRQADLQALIDRFAAGKCLARSGDRLVFPDEEQRFFVNGGWLEAYVFGRVFGMRKQRPTIQDVGRGVQVARQAGGGRVRNELDVAFLADNRLHVVECKTAAMDRADSASKALYKLSTLRAVLGGCQARALLVSFRDLTSAERRRADELHIEVIAGADLARLDQRLLSWIPT